MSAGITLRAYVLRKALNDVSPLFPTGSHTFPMLFKLSGSDLTLVCTTGCVYANTLEVSNPDNENWEITVIYKNLLEFITAEGLVTITHASYGVELSGDGYTINLPAGYSVITPPVFPEVGFTAVTHTGYIPGLDALVSMGLGSLYAADKPVHMYGQVSVLKFPNVQVQARTPGLDITALMSPEHVKLLTRFGADSWYTNNSDVLILKRDRAYMELPIEAIHEENLFVKQMEGLSAPVTLDLEHYLDKLRSMSKLNARGRCKLVIRETGVETSVNQDNLSIATAIGSKDGRVLSAVYLPLPLWMSMVKAAGNAKAQILYKGDIVCLRTQAIIILARALV